MQAYKNMKKKKKTKIEKAKILKYMYILKTSKFKMIS